MNLTAKYNRASEKEDERYVIPGIHETIIDESRVYASFGIAGVGITLNPDNIAGVGIASGVEGTVTIDTIMDAANVNGRFDLANVIDDRYSTVSIASAQIMASRIPTQPPDSYIGEAGNIYFDSQTNRLMVYNGAQWIAFNGVPYELS